MPFSMALTQTETQKDLFTSDNDNLNSENTVLKLL